MRKPCLIATFLVIVVGTLLPSVSASAQTVVHYNVATDDVFPEREDVDASVNVTCTVVYNCTTAQLNRTRHAFTLLRLYPGLER